jgi:PAS domain S-box-containing protein
MLRGFELHKQLQFLDTVLNTVQAGINVVDKDGKIVFVNDAYCKMNGYEREELIGNSLKVILPDKNSDEGLKNYKKIIHKQIPTPFVKESFNIKKNGEKFPVLISWNFLFDNDELQGMVTVVQDISKLKATESALAENKVRLQEITKSIEMKKSLTYQMGNSEKIETLFEKVRKIAATDFSVLLTGETGCGKEVVANAIHHLSKRRKHPFIKIDCGALSENLLESELFGHTKGAFTDAKIDKDGAFKQANKGTIFLDEITNLSFDLQKKLLRVIQEKEIKKIGSNNTEKLDIRIIAASNQKVHDLLKQGSFRDDLYFRLNEFSLHVPPLRQRKEDIPYLVKRFLNETCNDLKCKPKTVSKDALSALTQYNWPGNVRELINVIKHAIVLADKDIQVEHLLFRQDDTDICAAFSPLPAMDEQNPIDLKEELKKRTAEMEKVIIQKALVKCNGNKSKTAKFLNIDYKTMLTKIKKYEV